MSGLTRVAQNLRDKRRIEQFNNSLSREGSERGSTSASRKNMTVNELSNFFNKRKNYDVNEVRSGKYTTYSKNRPVIHKNIGPGPIGTIGGHIDGTLKQRFLKKVPDQGNPRYAASTTSSMCGGLITGLHTKNGFYCNEGEEKKYANFDESGVLLSQA